MMTGDTCKGMSRLKLTIRLFGVAPRPHKLSNAQCGGGMMESSALLKHQLAASHGNSWLSPCEAPPSRASCDEGGVILLLVQVYINFM